MGICTCKKRTDLFCFVHKKAVCENCIVTQHPTCPVKTYVDWLTDSEYEESRCGVCKGQLNQDNVLRLMCLDMFHPECLDVYAKSLPSHTAKAGFACPECKKPIFPTEEKSQLSQQLNKHLHQAPWAQNFLESIAPPSKAPTSGNSIIQNGTTVQTASSSIQTSGATLRPSAAQTSSLSFETPKKDYTLTLEKDSQELDEDDENKYKKKGVGELFVALGLAQPASAAVRSGTSTTGKNRQVRIRLNQNRIVLIIALFFTLVVVFVMAMSFSTGGGEENMLPPK